MLVNHFLENSADRLPEKVALICGEQCWTYDQINEKSNQLASYLIYLGIQRQDPVIIFLDNSFESVISIFAALKAGAIFIVLHPAMKSHKFRYICSDSGARAVITHTSKRRVVEESIEQTINVKHIIWTGQKRLVPANSGAAHYHFFEEIICQKAHQSDNHFPRCIDQDFAAIIYTSGSTGEPKGVVSSHFNVVSAVKSITTYLENREDDIIIDVLPLSFDYGLYQILMAFYFGGTIVLERSFVYPYRILEKLKQEQVTGFPIVPTIAAMILQINGIEKFDFTSLRYITNTAAALPVAHIKKMQKVFSRARIYSMYGLTECKRVSYLPPEYIDVKPKSVGIPIPNSEVFILKKDGQKAAPGEVGELVVRGSNVMRGYWNAPEETKQVFRPGMTGTDTWLYSGDLFRQDDEGFLYFVARKDDLIKTKGERVSPKEIENVLCSMEGVVEAAVIGIPDEILGQAIKAFIVKNGYEITEKMIKDYCNRNLEPFMVPKYIEFCESIPRSPVGKIDKKKLFKR